MVNIIMSLVVAAGLSGEVGQPATCEPTPLACKGPNLVVEVVDPTGGALPGAVVKAKANRSEGEKVLSTNSMGLAQFCVSGGARYDVRVTLQGFKARRVRSAIVPVSVYSAPAVQMRLVLEIPNLSITVE